MSQTNKFVKLCDLALFSNGASLKKCPCEKLHLNCNSQPKNNGWMFDTAQYKSLSFLVSSKLKEPGQILKGLYGMILNFDPLYLHRELQCFRWGYIFLVFLDPL